MGGYRGVSVVDGLSHEISIKHSFSYDGEPCDEVTHTQPPQLPRHLLTTETEKRKQDEQVNVQKQLAKLKCC